jgi:hypothetical protein
MGSDQGEQFNSMATEALTGLQAALTQAKSGLQSALNVVTGQGAGFAGGMPGMGMAGDMGAPEMGGEVDAMAQGAEELPTPPEADMDSEEMPAPKLGRGKR